MDNRRTRVKPELWWKVYNRDHRACIVKQLLPDIATPCTDRWGNPVSIRKGSGSSWGTTPYDLTLAHIKLEPGGARITDERHTVMACWGHHVLGDMAITSSGVLNIVRGYLRRLYPEG